MYICTCVCWCLWVCVCGCTHIYLQKARDTHDESPETIEIPNTRLTKCPCFFFLGMYDDGCADTDACAAADAGEGGQGEGEGEARLHAVDLCPQAKILEIPIYSDLVL